MLAEKHALSKKFANAVAKGEQRAPYSLRDGVKLKRVASCEHLTETQLAALLLDAFVRHSWLVQALHAAWEAANPGRRHDSHRMVQPGRHVLSLARAAAYAQHGNMQQAQKDARAAVAFCCGGGRQEPAADRASVEAAARCLLATALHAQEDWAMAAFNMHKAHELQEGEAYFQQQAARMTACVAEEEAREAAAEGGSEGLHLWMEQVAEQKLPEFLRPRPKYHYYNAWMRERIQALCPPQLLPEPVVQKLLEIDAGDLHFMCQHPTALVAQAEEYQSIHQQYGEQYLVEYQGEALSWEEVKALTGGDMVGLPIGYDAASNEPGFEDVSQAEAIEAARIVQQLAAAQPPLSASGSERLAVSRKKLVLQAAAAVTPLLKGAHHSEEPLQQAFQVLALDLDA